MDGSQLLKVEIAVTVCSPITDSPVPVKRKKNLEIIIVLHEWKQHTSDIGVLLSMHTFHVGEIRTRWSM